MQMTVDGITSNQCFSLRPPSASEEYTKIIRFSIERINRAVTQPEREEALTVMYNRLLQLKGPNGTNTNTIADRWLQAGAANALCLKLGYVSMQPEVQKREIDCMCNLLGMLYSRCSEAEQQLSMTQIGIELVPLLFRIVLALQQLPATTNCCCYDQFQNFCPTTHFYDKRKQHVGPSNNVPPATTYNTSNPIELYSTHQIVLSSLSLLYILTKSSPTNIKAQILQFLQHQHHPFLDSLLCYISLRKKCCHFSTLSIGIIKNFTFRASLELRLIISSQKELMNSLIETMMFSTETKHEDNTCNTRSSHFYHGIMLKNAEYASATIWNLVFHRNYSGNCCTSDDEKLSNFLSELMANEKLITTLSNLLLSKNFGSDFSQDDCNDSASIRIRRNAISILGTFASQENNKMSLLSYPKVLDSLLHAAQNDSDEDVRRRSLRTIRYLGQGGPQVATLVTLHSMDVLIPLATSNSYNRHDDEAKNQAIGAFSSLSSSANLDGLPEPLHRSIASTAIYLLLSSSNNTKKYTNNLVAALLHLSAIPKNWSWMVQDCTSLLDALCVVIEENSSVLAAESALKTLYNLAGEKANSKVMGRHQQVLDVLAKEASSDRWSSIVTSSRVLSVQIIVRLSEEPFNMAFLAGNSAVLTALVNFALDSPDDSLTKQTAKETLLRLVPDI